MAVRRRLVVAGLDGEVDRQEALEVFADCEALMRIAGGVLTIMPQRVQTGRLEGEMITTALVFEWKDRTDARPQPETSAVEVAAPELASEPEDLPEPVDAVLAPAAPAAPAQALEPPPAEESDVTAEDLALLAAAGGIVVGADGEPEEDLSSIPAAMR